jgi:hypothetical protein
VIGFIGTYTFTQFGTTCNYSAIAILHTFGSPLHTHALGFSVFTNRILATDISQSHCNFKLHMKSSWHHLIPFLPFPATAIPKITQFSPDYCSVLIQLPASEFDSLITTIHRPNGKRSLYCWRSLFTASLPSNRRSIVACSCVARMCLPTRCLEMGIHVTIRYHGSMSPMNADYAYSWWNEIRPQALPGVIPC